MLKKEASLPSASTRSLNKSRTISRTQKSILSEKSCHLYENVKEFEECFPTLCYKYGFLREVHVKKEYKEDIVQYYKHLQASESSKRRRTVITLTSQRSITSKPTSKHAVAETKDTLATDADEPELDIDAIIFAAMYDGYNRLIELFFYKIDGLPQEFIKILSFIARYYIDLRRLKIQSCKKMSGATIYEIAKLLDVSTITEIDLDGTYCKAENYGILFDSTRLINISLSKCRISDAVCDSIASKIRYKGPAENNLYCLNLSSNFITDVGAISLAKALRSNRKLRYLNLAANYITDEGASCILDSLKEFPLSLDEVSDKSLRYMAYERKKMIYYWRFLRDSISHSMSAVNKTNGKRKSTAFPKQRIGSGKLKDKSKDLKSHSLKALHDGKHSNRESMQQIIHRSPSYKALYSYEEKKRHAQIMADELMGQFYDPFQSIYITIREGKCYSKGNMSLCYLNLSFNNLGYLSVRKLLDVLKYQSVTKFLSQVGLVRVVINGNNLPVICEEYAKIDLLLTNSMKANAGKAFATEGGRRKSRVSQISVPY